MIQIRKPKPLWGSNIGVRNPALEELRDELSRVVDEVNLAIQQLDKEIREGRNSNGTVEN